MNSEIVTRSSQPTALPLDPFGLLAGMYWPLGHEYVLLPQSGGGILGITPCGGWLYVIFGFGVSWSAIGALTACDHKAQL